MTGPQVQISSYEATQSAPCVQASAATQAEVRRTLIAELWAWQTPEVRAILRRAEAEAVNGDVVDLGAYLQLHKPGTA